MALTLKESNSVVEMADILYDFLPGTPHPRGAQRLSFPAIAYDLGLAEYWTGGSKLPAISKLLEHTLEYKRGYFCRLIIEIVRRGNEKRRKSNPVTFEEITALNKAILGVDFKIPELYDPEFLNSLPRSDLKSNDYLEKSIDLGSFESDLTCISSLPPRERGYAFEGVLSGLFRMFDLLPRGGFRNTGEQIDGSFEFDGQTYLLEAKWQDSRIGQAELLVFHGKVTAKAAWARGLFVSYSGFSSEGLEAFRTGRSTKIICMDGWDLWEMINHNLDFKEVVRRKARRASESNDAYIPVRDLFPEI
ncbi:restriction endonuclease [Desulfocurvus sp. DL9XJH121]